jgi:hypothetical protein
MKIKKIEVTNLKAISNEVADFKGCSAIVTAGNNAGKSTMLRGLIDRFRGEKPEIILREGEEKGFSFMELTDGSKIEWKFTDKTESFSFTTIEGIKMTQGVLSSIGKTYFGVKFDIDKFLQSSPTEQNKMLSDLVGLDFIDIDKRYKTAYDERTLLNAEVKRLRAIAKTKPETVEKPKIDEFKKEKLEIEAKNKKINDQYDIDNLAHQKKIIDQNKINDDLRTEKQNAEDAFVWFEKYRTSIFADCIDFDKAKKIVDAIKVAEPNKPLTSLEKPILTPLTDIEEKIEKANVQQRLFDAYDRDLKEYNDWVKEGKEATEKANKKDEEVKAIQAEKVKMIAGAKLPAEFTFVDDSIFYNGFPFSNNQLSSSAKYIAALKLGVLSLGKVKAIHFDASFLDNISLNEIMNWATENDLQLLIERPDLDGGKIKYEIIEN